MALPAVAARDGAVLSPGAVELVGVAGKAEEYLFGTGEWDHFNSQLGAGGAIAGRVSSEVHEVAAAVFRQTVIDSSGVTDMSKCKTSKSQLYVRKVVEFPFPFLSFSRAPEPP